MEYQNNSSENSDRVNSVDVMNSNLTPYAKEFIPSSSQAHSSTFCEDNARKSGAVRKGTYWNNNKRYKNENRYQTRSDNENRYLSTRGETKYKPNESRSQYYNKWYQKSNFKEKSTEQSKVLEETKQFLQNMNSKEEEKDVRNNGYYDHEGSSYQTDNKNKFQGNGYGKNRSKVYKNSYKRDYGESKKEFNKTYELKSRDNFDKSKDNYERTKDNYERSKDNYERTKDNYERNNYERSKDHYDRNRDNFERNRDNYEKSRDNYERSRDNYEAEKFREKDGFRRDRKVEEKKKLDFEYRKSGFRKKLDAGSQRERLEQLITCRLLECLVCCEKLRHTDQVWSCKQCYHILHLFCVKQWADSSKLEAGWRCPACQNVYQDLPKQYRCYCSKQTNPVLEPGGLPHSCGNTCGRKGRTCEHTCTLVCHPGPCPDCTVMVPRSCGCGATKPIVKCSSTVPVICQAVCNKLLDCGIHRCVSKCHENGCGACKEVIRQECYCGKEGRKINCTSEEQANVYGCGDICGKTLRCGNHKCEKECHPGPCDSCTLMPDKITTCSCGQTKLTQLRSSCLDPIPCCDKICSKKLMCGQPSAPHLCKSACHEGACPPCLQTTIVRCRCGHMDKEIPCEQLTTKADDARCEKKCTKKRLCGKHKCNQMCCIEMDHICPLICNRPLSCGQHRCEEQCHKGRCPPCWRTSFDELYCECGASVLYPPVACGTRPPPCDKPCSRPQTCSHEVLHTCHTGPCPPCTVLCKRWCHGHHEQRGTIPCHQTTFSCGLPCGKDMCCGKHKCQQPCHEGPCRAPCTQPCTEPRADCGHPCNQPCHNPPCPETSCKQMVKVTCQCGLRRSNRICMELSGEYQNIAMAQLASKMEEMQQGYAVDISDIIGGQKKGTLKTLECNDECRLVERNRRLAIGLQIRNPDLSAKLTPKYSDFMRGWAKKDLKFCQHVHEKLTELVQLAKQSKQKSRSYSFESMNRDKRHFVHEYCEHFGCDSAAYDPEPNRNVVATAFKDRSWLPSYSLLAVIQRESGQRKVPGPQQLGKGNVAKVDAGKGAVVSLKLPGRAARPATPPGEYVDYFDNPPE